VLGVALEVVEHRSRLVLHAKADRQGDEPAERAAHPEHPVEASACATGSGGGDLPAVARFADEAGSPVAS
jgi:hypothetical protein